MIKVGIIGASFARAAYLPALRLIEAAHVTAIASGRFKSAKETAAEFGIPQVFEDWQEMLGSERFDLVCIATPTVLHAPMTLAAIAAGAHVLCEKPTAMNAGEARTMLEAAEAAGRLHMIDHELRFNPNRMRIAELIASGALGEIRHANITNIGASWTDPAARPMGDWWSDATQGGGRLGANGSHQVDMLRWWLGEPASVIGEALTIVPARIDKDTGVAWTATADDLSYFTMRMQTGALANVFMSGVAATNMGNETQIFGSKGTLILSNSDERLYFARDKNGFQDITVPDPNAERTGLNKGIWNVSVLAALTELTAAITENRALKQGATFVDGLRNQAVLDAVQAATKSRAWVDLPNPEGA